MSASASPNPTNLLMLAALGIGAYWFMSRRAAAAQVPTQGMLPNQRADRNYQTGAVLGGLVGAVSGLFGRSSNGTYDGRSAQPWDVTPYGDSGPRFNNPSAFTLASSAIDGLAVNPTTQAAFDYAAQADAGWLGF
jgi:hypothetical protein